MSRVGATASRTRPTQLQHSHLYAWFASRERGEAHHGDCVGGDEVVHAVAQYHGWRIVSHPASGVGPLRAYCTGCAEVREPKPPLLRNDDILAETDELVALPDGPERLRSGTWSTIRKARALRRPITIFWPDGSVTTENQPLAQPTLGGPTGGPVGPGKTS